MPWLIDQSVIQDAGWTVGHGTHKQEGIRAGLESPRPRGQHMHDGITENVPGLPQRPEGWKFESFVGQSESGDNAFRPIARSSYHSRIIGERIRIDTNWSDAKLCHFFQRPPAGISKTIRPL